MLLTITEAMVLNARSLLAHRAEPDHHDWGCQRCDFVTKVLGERLLDCVARVDERAATGEERE